MKKVLIVGGAGQGKLDYARQAWGITEVQIGCAGAEDMAETLEKPCIAGLHHVVRVALEQGNGPDGLLEAILAKAAWVITCDEVGSGVVPVQGEERRWREAIGRLCCALARQADVVVRITCGLPMALKGELE